MNLKPLHLYINLSKDDVEEIIKALAKRSEYLDNIAYDAESETFSKTTKDLSIYYFNLCFIIAFDTLNGTATISKKDYWKIIIAVKQSHSLNGCPEPTLPNSSYCVCVKLSDLLYWINTK